MLSETDWTIPLLNPSRQCSVLLTVSLLVPYISDLRDVLNHTLDVLKLHAAAGDPLEMAAGKANVQCVEALVEG